MITKKQAQEQFYKTFDYNRTPVTAMTGKLEFLLNFGYRTRYNGRWCVETYLPEMEKHAIATIGRVSGDWFLVPISTLYEMIDADRWEEGVKKE